MSRSSQQLADLLLDDLAGPRAYSKSERTTAHRLLIRLGQALGVVDEAAAEPVRFDRWRYQRQVLAAALRGAACSLLGSTASAGEWTPLYSSSGARGSLVPARMVRRLNVNV